MVFELPPVHLVLVLEAVGTPCILYRHLDPTLPSTIPVEVGVALIFRALDFGAVLAELAEVARQDHGVWLQAHLSPACRPTQELLDCRQLLMLKGRVALPCLRLPVDKYAGGPEATVDVHPAEFTFDLLPASTLVEFRELFEIWGDILSLAHLLLRLDGFGGRG